jgi:hypothetical protein
MISYGTPEASDVNIFKNSETGYISVRAHFIIPYREFRIDVDVTPFHRFFRRIYEGLHQESKHLPHPAGGMCGRVYFILIVIQHAQPDLIKIAVIITDKIFIPVIKPYIYSFIVFIHIDVPVFNRKISRSDNKLRRTTEISNC